MDSQPSGSNNELLTIETDKVLFVLKGEKYGTCKDAVINLDTFNNSDKPIEFNHVHELHLTEYSDYEIIIESKCGADIEFFSNNINIRNKVAKVTSRSKNLSGIINFRGDIGLTDFLIKADNKEEFKLTLEVFPSKISYKEDYKALLEDVNNEIYNLAYGFLARTYLNTDVNNKSNRNNTEFYSILNYVFEKLIKAINIVLQNPNHILQKERNIVKYHNIRKISKETVKYLEKRPQLLKNVNNRYLPVQALVVNKKITMNTKENKLIKFMLVNIIDKINKFQLNYKNIYKNKDSFVVEKLDSYKRQINKKINSSFLKYVKSEFIDGSLSLVFMMGNGYREIYKYYLMLQKGLSIKSGLFSLSIKELSQLYEYWCFIKINSLLQKRYKLLTCDMLKINSNGITVSLKKGKTSCLKYLNENTGEEFKVYYNLSSSSRTINQKPDNILSLDKEGYSKSYEFIFDAKYKIDYSSNYIESYGSPGPKEDDINTMHRYRDAIVYDNKKKNEEVVNKFDKANNCIFGAFVLFPYNDEEKFRQNKFYKSIDEVNIGAIPFLPSTTKLMEEFLDELINESSYSTYERALEPIGKEVYLTDRLFSNREVLVGNIKDKNSLDSVLHHNFYYVPKKSINMMNNHIEYIALAQSKNVFKENSGILYIGKIKEVELVKRNEIYEIPSKSEELYYRFKIEKWNELSSKISIDNIGVRRPFYTSKYLINNSSKLQELFIKSKDEYRLFKELERFSDSNVINEIENNKNLFFMGNIKIELDENIIKVSVDGKDIDITKESFFISPRRIIRQIMKLSKS